MNLNNSSLRDLIIKLISEYEAMRLHELREKLEMLDIMVDTIELRTIIADMMREGLLHKVVGIGFKRSSSIKP